MEAVLDQRSHQVGDRVGSRFAGLSAQIDVVLLGLFWSGSAVLMEPGLAWLFRSELAFQSGGGQEFPAFAVAVRPGDVAAAIPEAQTFALIELGADRTLSGVDPIAVRRHQVANCGKGLHC
jgi:hypothetical protein